MVTHNSFAGVESLSPQFQMMNPLNFSRFSYFRQYMSTNLDTGKPIFNTNRPVFNGGRLFIDRYTFFPVCLLTISMLTDY